MPMDRQARIRRLRFRAWHRGTREADYIFGGFFDAHHAGWDEAAIAWFETLLDEDDADILGWAMGTEVAPQRFAGPQLDALRRLDFVKA